MKKKIIRVATVDVSFNLLKGQLKFLNKHYDVIGVASNGPNIEKTQQKEGIRVECVNMERQISIIKDLKSLYNLYILFKKEKPFIVHSITPKAGLLSMIASYFARVPHRIHTFTGLIFPTSTGLMQKILIFTDKVLCYFANKIFPEGQGVKNDLIAYNITKKPLKIIANGNVNGIDVDYFTPNLYTQDIKNNYLKELGISINDVVFVFAGRLVSDKGINELMLAYNKISDNYQNVKLLLVGTYESELDPLLPESLEIIENNKTIISTGWVDDVRPYLAISNALTFPSYREGFPNVVMQAGAMELPCIVTNINGCNEIIEHNKTGIIIPVKQVDALYEAMSFVLDNPTESKKMGVLSRKYIVNHFERQVVWDALLDEYNSLK